MKRRKALLGISLLAGSAFAYVGFKWLKINSVPDFDYLKGNKRLLAALADTIIPKSDSPSASECNVHEFIIKMVIESTEARTQNNFMSGLVDLEEYSVDTFGKSFIDCSSQDKNQVLAQFSDRDKTKPGIIGKVQKKILGKPFFETLREYTVVGYFTSEQGATQALRYSLVPSRYEACVPYSAGEKAWATF
jgi:Gluconate 2-dehydrogenase subunit 3